MNILDFFLVYLGNWNVIAMIVSLYYVLLKTSKNRLYKVLWNGIEFNRKWIPLTISIVTIILLREHLLYSLPSVQEWMPGSYLWEQVVFWLYTTHTISILTYCFFIYYFWRKFNSFFPALLLGFFSIGVIEFTFIIQHLVIWNLFLGFNWYSAFGVILIPFLIEYHKFKIVHKKALIVFLTLAFINQYIILPVMEYSITVFDAGLGAYRLNYDLLPHPPIQTWLFYCVGQTTMKMLFLLAFSQIRLKEIEE